MKDEPSEVIFDKNYFRCEHGEDCAKHHTHIEIGNAGIYVYSITWVRRDQLKAIATGRATAKEIAEESEKSTAADWEGGECQTKE